jgi:hypothetical protein
MAKPPLWLKSLIVSELLLQVRNEVTIEAGESIR